MMIRVMMMALKSMLCWTCCLIFVTGFARTSSSTVEAAQRYQFFQEHTLDVIARKFFATVETLQPHKKLTKRIQTLEIIEFETPEQALKAIESYPENGTFVDEISRVMLEIESKLTISCSKNCEPCPEVDEDCDALCGTNDKVCTSDRCPPCPIPIWCPLIPKGQTCPPKPNCPEDLCPQIRNNTPGFSNDAKRNSTDKPIALLSKSTTMRSVELNPKSGAGTTKPNSSTLKPLSSTPKPKTTAAATRTTSKASKQNLTTNKVAQHVRTSSSRRPVQSVKLLSFNQQHQQEQQCDSKNVERGHSPRLYASAGKSRSGLDSTASAEDDEGGSSRAAVPAAASPPGESQYVKLAIKRSGLLSGETRSILQTAMPTLREFNSIQQDLMNILQGVSRPENPLGRLFTMIRGRSAEDKASAKELRLFTGDSSRSFSYDTNLRFAQRIIVEVLRDLFRRKCNCPQCPTKIKKCKCKLRSTCKPEPAQKCLPCPPPNQCPVPAECNKTPPCQDCNDLELNKYYPDDKLTKKLSDQEKQGLLTESFISKAYVKPQCVVGKPDCEDMKKCGVAPKNRFQRKKASGYMRGGEKSEKGEWAPFIRVDSFRDEGTMMCGGVLISRNKVLTAAHCISKVNTSLEPSQVQATAAVHDAKKLEPTDQYRNISQICRASKFYDAGSAGSRNDFAVLTLEKPFQLTEDVQPACLAYDPKKLDHQRCWVIGMGVVDTLNSGQEVFADHLLMMKVKRVSCSRWGLSESDPSRWCFTKALGPGDTCAGDSGGPVLCLDKDNKLIVAGLVSYGTMECDGTDKTIGWVGVYTRIPHLLDDIQQDCKIFNP